MVALSGNKTNRYGELWNERRKYTMAFYTYTTTKIEVRISDSRRFFGIAAKINVLPFHRALGLRTLLASLRETSSETDKVHFLALESKRIDGFSNVSEKAPKVS